MTNTLNWSNQGWQKGDRENQAHAMGGYFHITTTLANEVLYDVDFNWMENRKGDSIFCSTRVGKSNDLADVKDMAENFVKRGFQPKT